MDQPNPTEFRRVAVPGLAEAITHARRAMASVTAQPIDAIASCEKVDGDIWRLRVEVIESPARMGDNDLLSAYEVEIAAGGEVQGFRRLSRYHREEGDGL